MNPENKIEDAQIIVDQNVTTVTSVQEAEPTNKVSNASAVSIISLDRQTGKPDMSKYTPQQIQKYTQMSTSLKTSDSNSILNFGLELQNKLAGYSDSFLNNVRSFDAGEIGGSINNLLSEVNYIDIDPSQQSGLKRIMMQIPLLKGLVMNTKKIFQKYDTVSNNIDGIVKKLDQGRLTIIKDNNQLQNLFEQNVEYIKDLEELIVAGHIRYDELDKEIKLMEMTPENYQDYDIADKKEFLNRLSKRLTDMAMTRVITIQSLPQIRLVQNNNLTMVEKIQSSITTTIPIWKNQISIAVALMRQKNILDVQEKIYETTNTILKKNSEMLKVNSIAVAKQNERGVVSLDTLRAVNQDLVSTLNDIKRIKEEGEATRKTAVKELETLENDLKKNVLQLGTEGKTNY
jgi:uncharacterized protein YaaN involved in tellurite resistance